MKVGDVIQVTKGGEVFYREIMSFRQTAAPGGLGVQMDIEFNEPLPGSPNESVDIARDVVGHVR